MRIETGSATGAEATWKQGASIGNTAASGIAAAGARGIATVKQRVRRGRGEAEKYIGARMR